MNVSGKRAGAILSVNLDAIASNYTLLRKTHTQQALAAVIKEDAYGLGLEPVARTLWKAGNRMFFVAFLDEAEALRKILPEADIHVLSGFFEGTAEDFFALDVVPVLNTPEEIATWRAIAKKKSQKVRVDLHVDTGMNRLGLTMKEAETVAENPHSLEGFDVSVVMSHLACADTPEHALNETQRDRFETVRKWFPMGQGSFAASSGIFLDPSYHFDLGRPGAAVFGVNPQPENPSPMTQVIELKGKIVQVRDVDTHQGVGYGATHRTRRKSRIATVTAGYGDGYLRSLSNKGAGYLSGHTVPVVGRVSMDLITFDVTDVPEKLVHAGAEIELIGTNVTVDDVAEAAGTNGYEVLTALGARYHRTYSGQTA